MADPEFPPGYIADVEAAERAAREWMRGRRGLRLGFVLPPDGVGVVAGVAQWEALIGQPVGVNAESQAFVEQCNEAAGGRLTMIQLAVVIDRVLQRAQPD